MASKLPIKECREKTDDLLRKVDAFEICANKATLGCQETHTLADLPYYCACGAAYSSADVLAREKELVAATKRPRGAPPKGEGNVREIELRVRMTETERADVGRRAEERGLILSDWVRQRLGPIDPSDLERDLLLRDALAPLRGRFSAAELRGCLDALNGAGALAEVVGVDRIGANLIPEVADAIRLNGLDKKWSFDGPSLMCRLAKLKPREKRAIEIWAAGLWRRHQTDRESWLITAHWPSW